MGARTWPPPAGTTPTTFWPLVTRVLIHHLARAEPTGNGPYPDFVPPSPSKPSPSRTEEEEAEPFTDNGGSDSESDEEENGSDEGFTTARDKEETFAPTSRYPTLDFNGLSIELKPLENVEWPADWTPDFEIKTGASDTVIIKDYPQMLLTTYLENPEVNSELQKVNPRPKGLPQRDEDATGMVDQIDLFAIALYYNVFKYAEITAKKEKGRIHIISAIKEAISWNNKASGKTDFSELVGGKNEVFIDALKTESTRRDLLKYILANETILKCNDRGKPIPIKWRSYTKKYFFNLSFDLSHFKIGETIVAQDDDAPEASEPAHQPFAGAGSGRTSRRRGLMTSGLLY